MKRILIWMFVVVLLGCSGCNGADINLNQALSLRESVLSGNSISFDVRVTADYGEKLYSFSMNCAADADGNTTFTVTEPDTISGISGIVSESGGKITFDDKVLVFELLADGQITPVSAPWLLVQTLRSGYISGCGRDGDGIHIQFDDSYEDDSLRLDLWTGENGLPKHAEILWQSRRIVSMEIENFIIL